MKSYDIRRAPWTCEWGRFGVASEDFVTTGRWLDDVFWACHHPTRPAQHRLTARDACEECPFWEPFTRFRQALDAPNQEAQ